MDWSSGGISSSTFLLFFHSVLVRAQFCCFNSTKRERALSVVPWLWNGWLYAHEASAHVPGSTCGTGSWVLWCMYEMDVVFNQHDMDFFLHITAKRLCEWPRNNDYIQWTCSTHSWPEIFWYCYTKALWRRDFLVFSILLLKANFFVYVAVVAVFLICKILRYWYTVVHTCDLLSEISAL